MAEVRSQKSEVRSQRCLLAAAAFCLLPLTSFAAFERQDTGARQSAMGEAFSAVGGDANCLFNNPAGLSYVARKEAASSYNMFFLGLDDGSSLSGSMLLYGQPVRAREGFGAGWLETRLGALYKERTLAFGYGYSLKDSIRIGAALKQLQVSVQKPSAGYNNSGTAVSASDPVFANGNSASGVSADLGALYVPDDVYSLGLSLQNINQPEVSLADSSRVPLLIRLGAARRSAALLLSSEIRTREILRGTRDLQAVIGAERWWNPEKGHSFALRGSLAYGNREFSQLALGLGYRVKDVRMDYAFLMPLRGVTFGGTSGTHQFSVAARFGRPSSKKSFWDPGTGGEWERQDRIEQELREQVNKLEEELERQRRLQNAISTTTVGVEPSMQRVIDDLNGQIRDIKLQLEEATRKKPAGNFKAKPEYSKIATDPERSREFFRKGMRYYSLRQLKRAIEAFRKSLEYDPSNEWAKKSLERTLNELEQEKSRGKTELKYEEIRYTARKGDTLQSLAGTFYGDAEKWQLIRDVNPDVDERQKIAEGTVIIIPQIPEISVPAPEAAK